MCFKKKKGVIISMLKIIVKKIVIRCDKNQILFFGAVIIGGKHIKKKRKIYEIMDNSSSQRNKFKYDNKKKIVWNIKLEIFSDSYAKHTVFQPIMFMLSILKLHTQLKVEIAAIS